MKLAELRNKIDLVDNEILTLLNKRMELAVRTKSFKSGVVDNNRDDAVLENVKSKTRKLLLQHCSESLFSQIIMEAKKLQEMDFNLIGFQGEHGDFAELASLDFDNQVVAIPHKQYLDVFNGISSGALQYGIVPIENSLTGNVSQVDDLLLESDLVIVAEIKLPLKYSLLALPGADHRDIRVVYSDPQVLSFCRGFIERNRLDPNPFYNTAGAAKMLAHERPAATAVIASHLCAEIYNLEPLKEDISDRKDNYTRFVVLAKSDAAEEFQKNGDKCTIAFSAPHKPGALFNVLSAFSESGINLTRIESRLLPSSPGTYGFLLDFLGSHTEENVQRALEQAKAQSDIFKFLGCYKRSS